MQPVFSIAIRIYYEDTDAAGVVYYANYLKFMERARTEWLRAAGFELDSLAQRDRVMFVVRSANLDFLKPARFNDAVHVDVAISEHRGASIAFVQRVRRADAVLCEAHIRIACVDSTTHAPRALPVALAARLKEISP